jgi:hypothetical protein
LYITFVSHGDQESWSYGPFVPIAREEGGGEFTARGRVWPTELVASSGADEQRLQFVRII